jgi:hypothetical protein
MLARVLVTFWAYGWSAVTPLAWRPLPQKLVACWPKGWSPVAFEFSIMASGKYLPTSSSRQVPAGKYLCSRKYLRKYLRAQMPPRDKRGPPAILPSRPWPRYLGFVMLTSRAWFPSSPSCEPELGIRNAVRVVNERPRGVGK